MRHTGDLQQSIGRKDIPPKVSAQDMASLRMGADFAAGIYQVKVVQGTDSKTLKVVKQ